MLTERRRIECLRDIVKYCDQIEAFLIQPIQGVFQIGMVSQLDADALHFLHCFAQ